jgi:hypothetical protein
MFSKPLNMGVQNTGDAMLIGIGIDARTLMYSTMKKLTAPP